MASRTRSRVMAALVLACATSVPLGATERTWYVASADRAEVFSGDSGAMAVRALTELHRARWAIQQLVGLEYPLPIRVFASAGESSVRELVPHYWEGRGVRPVAASYAGPHAGFIAIRTDLPDAQRSATLLHEYVHLLTAATQPDAPAWLDEGVSEFWGSLRIDHNQIVIGRPLAAHIRQLRTHPWLPLDDLLSVKRGALPTDRQRALTFYAQSWALVHYLLIGNPSGPLSLSPGELPPTAVLDTAVRAYAAAPFRQIAVTPPSRPLIAAEARPVTEARSLAERAAMLVFGQRPEAALPLARRALGRAAAEPLALEVIGTYHFLRNEPDAARSWLARSLEANPDSYVSALYLSLLSSSASDRERYLRAAVRSKPDSITAWQRLWTLYVNDGRAAGARRWCHGLRQLLALGSYLPCELLA